MVNIRPRRPVAAVVCAAAFVAIIVTANWAATAFEPVTMWPGSSIKAPAAVLFVGVGLTVRDLLHDAAGWVWTVGAIVAGSVLSAGLAYATQGERGVKFAAGAGTAFLASELLDLAVYVPLRRRGRWLLAVAASNTAGLLVDSVVFLWLAFGSMAFLPGQIIGKLAVTAGTVALIAVGRRALRAWRVRPATA